jgi:hypothetical protein
MRIVTYKTAFYTFYLPVACGLVLAGITVRRVVCLCMRVLPVFDTPRVWRVAAKGAHTAAAALRTHALLADGDDCTGPVPRRDDCDARHGQLQEAPLVPRLCAPGPAGPQGVRPRQAHLRGDGPVLPGESWYELLYTCSMHTCLDVWGMRA